MPWCESCAKFWTPSTMKPDGSCPSCGRVLPVAEGAQPAITVRDLRRMAAGEGGDESDARAPWHFKLMLVALAVYLGWRAVQLVMLIVR